MQFIDLSVPINNQRPVFPSGQSVEIRQSTTIEKDSYEDHLLQSENRGRERYYSLNPKYPLFQEYRRIVLKTVGLEFLLKEILKELPGIKKAFIFGSYAEDRMDESSDIDLMVSGEHDTLELQRRITRLQQKLSREINLVSLSSEEYEKRQKESGFIASIDKKPKVVLI